MHRRTPASTAVEPGDIQRRAARIAGLRMLALGINISALLDQHLNLLHRKVVGHRGVHQRCATCRIGGVHVRAVPEHQPNQVGLVHDRHQLQRDGVLLRVQYAGHQKIYAFRALRSSRVRQRKTANVFELGAAVEQRLHDFGVAGQRSFQQRRRFRAGIGRGIGIRAMAQ